MSVFFLSLFIFFFNLLIFLNFKNLTNYLSFFDKPDGKLKKHKKPVSLVGGLIILINLFLTVFFLKILELDYLLFQDNFSYIIVILGTMFFLIGFIDDLKNLSPNIKLVLLLISIFLITILFPEIKLKIIKISFLDQIYFFKNFSLLFTILSFALLANAMNMFDGINLQLIFFTLFVFLIFILKGFLPIFFILISICLIFLAILNFSNKVFIGDGGCYLISAIIGCTFIYQYKNFENFFFGDEVFIILLVPAMDMLRLFTFRIIRGKHPFKGDLKHLHHLVDKLTQNRNYTIIITLSLSIFPFILMIIGLKTYLILILNFLIYLTLVLFLEYKIKS